MRLINRKGQGMLEYIVILAAVLVAIIAFVGNGGPGTPLHDTVRVKVLDGASDELNAARDTITLQ